MSRVHKDTHETLNSPENRGASDRGLLWWVTVVSILFAAAHLMAAFAPTAKNWGIHHLAFFPRVARLSIPVLMLMALLPAIQQMFIENISRVHNWFERQTKISKWMLLAVLLLACSLLFWFLRERTFFLGDGFMIARWLEIVDRVKGVQVFFKHEPLTGLLAWCLSLAFSTVGVPSVHEVALQTLSIVFGLGSVIMIMLLSRELFSEFHDRFFFTMFLFVSGVSQLFFGYIENYTPTYFGLLGYTLLGVLYLRGKVSLLLPSIAFGVLFTLYFGILGFVPTLLLLFYHSARLKNFRDIGLSIVATILTSGGILWFMGYTFNKLYEIFFRDEGHIVPLTKLSSGWKAYSMFSLPHLLEVGNLYLLLLPYVPLLLYILIKRNFRQRLLRVGEAKFLLLSGVLGIIFTMILNPDIGMSRDWDLMSPFFLTGMIAAGWLLVKCVQRETRHRIFAIIIVAMMLHTVPWVAVNADVDRSIARFNMLPDEDLWGRNAFRVYEELGMYYEEHHDTLKTMMYYERVLLHDSTNGRMLGNLAGLYLLRGNEEKALAYGEKAITYGSKAPEVYYNVGAYYAKRDRFDEALPPMIKSLELDPTKATTSYSIGIIYADGKRDFQSALKYFNHALTLDPSFAQAYLDAGLCLLRLHQPEQARRYFEPYFILYPNDPQREKINRLLNVKQ
jgi:tetratricopeptide (TPR) repeat protein